MAAERSNSEILLGLDSKAAQIFTEGKKAPVKVGSGFTLPPGINNGVAQLVRIGFEIHKEGKSQGKPYLFATGIVKKPLEFGGESLVGRQTKIIPVTLAEVGKKTFADQVIKAMNYFKLLFGEQAVANLTTLSQLGTLADAVMKSPKKPYFMFRTWIGKRQVSVQRGGMWFAHEETSPGVIGKQVSMKGYKSVDELKVDFEFLDRDPMVNEEWGKAVDFTEAPSNPVNPAMVRSSVPPPTSVSVSVPATPPSANTNGVTQPTTPVMPLPPGVDEEAATEQANEIPNDEEESSSHSSQDFDEFGDLDSRTERAVKGSEEDRDYLTQKAIEAGYTNDEIEETKTWYEVRSMIENPRNVDEEIPSSSVDNEGEQENDSSDKEDGEPVEAYIPKKGDTCGMRLWSKKDKSYTGDVVPVKITTVNAKDEVVNCTRLDTKPAEKLTAVPFSAFVATEE